MDHRASEFFNQFVYITHSADRGDTWTTTLVGPVNGDPDFFRDKCHVAVDDSPSSPGYGNAYVAWDESEAIEPEPIGAGQCRTENNRVKVAVSKFDASDSTGRNGLGSWGVSDRGVGFIQGGPYAQTFSPSIAIGPLGEVYIAYMLYPRCPALLESATAIGLSTGIPDPSQASGVVWNADTIAVAGITGVLSGSPEGGVDAWKVSVSYPVMVCDLSSGQDRGTVYLSWTAFKAPGFNVVDVFLASATPASGATPDFSTSTVRSCGNDASVNQFIHWLDLDNNDGSLVAFFYNGPSSGTALFRPLVSTSRDGGLTWSDIPVSGSEDAFAQVASPAKGVEYAGVAVSAGTAFPLWMDGRTGQWDVHFARVDLSADFQNRSSDTVFGFGGTPYSSVVVDYVDDSRDDMFLTDAISAAGVLRGAINGQASDLPAFVDFAQIGFPGGIRPSSSRGTAFGDYDNDGDPDLFVASRVDPRLFRNDGTFFTDVTSSIDTPFATEADSSWCGAWGDYDRDGDLDLYVGRAGGAGDTSSGALVDRLYKNRGDGTFVLANGPTSLGAVTQTATTTVSWADLTGDGDLDLFVGSADVGVGSVLLEQQLYLDPNDPTGTTVHTFVESSTRLPSSPTSLDEIIGATWRDLNNDSHLDLLLAGRGSGENGTRILWNDGSGSLASTSTIDGGMASLNAAVFDMDLDGGVDVLVARPLPNASPAVLKNNKDGTFGSAASFSNVTGVSGVASATEFRAIQAVDIAGPSNTPDGDEDLYLGRPSTSEEFFYQNAPGDVDVPTNRWLKVKLSSDRSNTADGIGAQVHVQAGTLEQTQIVDGGSGVGSQNPSTLLFGLGDTSSDAVVTVTWPDGYTQVESVLNADLDETLSIADDHDPSLDAGSVLMRGFGYPDSSTDWVFEWETDYVCDPEFTKINIRGTGSRFCSGPDFGTGTVVSAQTAWVSIQMEPKPGGGYVHRLIWANQPCGIVCSYEYKVYSAVNSSVGEWSPTWKEFSTSVCISQ